MILRKTHGAVLLKCQRGGAAQVLFIFINLSIYNLLIGMNIKYIPGNTIYCSLRLIESVLPTSGILTLAS